VDDEPPSRRGKGHGDLLLIGKGARPVGAAARSPGTDADGGVL